MENAWELCESQELSVVSDEECGERPGLKPVVRGKKKGGHEIYETFHEDC